MNFDKSGNRICFDRNASKDYIQESLDICFKVAHILKEEFPNEIMKINDDTILMYDKKDRRIKKKSANRLYAYYTNATPHRIILTKKTLSERLVASTDHDVKWEHDIWDQSSRYTLEGNHALLELMAHELAHHQTSGHKAGWKIKYKRFYRFMINQMISGKFYKASTEAGGESV